MPMFALARLTLVLIVALPLASAQAASEASLELSVAPGPVDIELGDSHDAPIEVTFSLRGVVCTSAATAVVPVTVKDKPSPLAGVRGTVEPAEFRFEIPAGGYSSAPYSKRMSGSLRVSVDESALSGHDHEFELTAAYAGGVPSGCQGAGSVAATDAVASHKITTGGASSTATTPSHQMTDGSSMSGAEHSGATNDAPAASLVLLLGVVFLVALARRR